MSDVNNEEKMGQIRRSVDLNVLGDNILDIADFTVEKYEFRTDSTLSPEMRAEAVEKIKDALWKRVEEIRLRRKQILEMMFNLAEVTLNEVVDKK